MSLYFLGTHRRVMDRSGGSRGRMQACEGTRRCVESSRRRNDDRDFGYGRPAPPFHTVSRSAPPGEACYSDASSSLPQEDAGRAGTARVECSIKDDGTRPPLKDGRGLQTFRSRRAPHLVLQHLSLSTRRNPRSNRTDARVRRRRPRSHPVLRGLPFSQEVSAIP